MMHKGHIPCSGGGSMAAGQSASQRPVGGWWRLAGTRRLSGSYPGSSGSAAACSPAICRAALRGASLSRSTPPRRQSKSARSGCPNPRKHPALTRPARSGPRSWGGSEGWCLGRSPAPECPLPQRRRSLISLEERPHTPSPRPGSPLGAYASGGAGRPNLSYVTRRVAWRAPPLAAGPPRAFVSSSPSLSVAASRGGSQALQHSKQQQDHFPGPFRAVQLGPWLGLPKPPTRHKPGAARGSPRVSSSFHAKPSSANLS